MKILKTLINERIQYKDNVLVYKTNFKDYDKEKETVLLLHPAFADHRIFIKQFEDWQDKYNLIAIDMAGHGENNQLSHQITIEDMPYIINEIMLEKEILRLHVVGVSMGSLVAQGIADRLGQKVKSITVVGGYSIHKHNKHILKQQQKEMSKWLLMILFRMNKFRQYVTSVSTHSKLGQQVFRMGADCFTRKSFIAMQGMGKLMKEKEVIMDYPMLLMAGEEDLPLAITAIQELHQIEPNSQIALIAKAGHCVNIDQPAEFNCVVESFIDKHR